MSPPLRIIHAALSLRESYGGPARSIPALADALAERGLDVVLLTADNEITTDPLVRPRHSGVTFTTVPGVLDGSGLALWMPRFRAAITHAMAPGVPTVLHDHGLWRATNRAMAAVARAKSVPLVVSPRGMLQEWAREHRGARKRVAWALYARRDLASVRALHATSASEARTLLALGLRVPVVLVPNGVAMPERVASADHDRATRRLLFLGRLAPIKGLTTLVEAWRMARPSGWTLTLAGPDEDGYAASVRRAIADAGVAESVTLTGGVRDADKWALISAHDAVVLPSHSESFGVAVAEGLAAGRPAITTTGTPWQSLVDARCGWWVSPDARSLADAIRALAATSGTERDAMGRAGRALVERAYSWARVAEQLTAVYEWAARGGAPPDSLVRP